MNYQDSKIYNKSVNKLQITVDSLKLEQLEKAKKMLDLKNSFQRMEYYRTNTQKNDKN
jgi:hypothetical protein